ncbi:SusC/RagA family TonB-linked outer membrane protein [Gemmatirosa kalamazoonensis]|uniref:SusC/RagA family TonB-linked outer membrane protein n=1 Tax=Gemmatirosa kalamazoonensis TaxID=861299 RepID=UPI00046D0420|nr:SusC/RagA family TonB-linked outer membrane protein [Gemmatirosa kalamazoonensis]
MALLGATALTSGQVAAQRIRVAGTVTSAGGAPLGGAQVRALGSDTAALTNAQGRYAITAPGNGTLQITFIGFRPVEVPINGRTTVDVSLERLAVLEQVLVTGYTQQRRAEITGAVATVNTQAVERQTTASVVQRLAGNVSGVQVEASGSPGSRSTVRIRGVSSFQNNDPLYIVDGTPVQDSYVNWLNADDVESVQVLKDASSASIYGARASNGVVIIETKKGRAGQGVSRATLRVRTGLATPVRGYDDILIQSPLDYFQVVKQSYLNAGYKLADIQSAVYGRNLYGDPNSPSVPQYIYCGSNTTCSNVDVSKYGYPNNLIVPGSAGTNWWKQVFGTGKVGDYNLDVAGGGVGNTYNLSFNYFDQIGTARFNRYQRGSIRVNTSFNRAKFFTGENIALSGDRGTGGLPNDPGGYAEDGILGKNVLMQPVIPVRDIQGNFASGKAQGLGNQSNPLKLAYEHRDDVGKNGRIFGSAFAGFDVTPKLNLRSTLGLNVGQGSFAGYSPPLPENSEPTFNNGINENNSSFQNFTWSNTARYSANRGPHTLGLLIGQEVIRGSSRFMTGSLGSLISTDIASRYIQDALGDASTKSVSSSGSRNALVSYFGKADYNLLDRYLVSFTVRRDGSSNLGRANRWGTFPAAGLGWRLSQEPFFPKDNAIFSDVRLRAGWGVTGNQQIPSGRIVSTFGGDRGDVYYDINGSNNSIVAGFRQTQLGNANLKWEENRSTNVGADLSLFRNNVDLVVDVWQRKTNNLLFDPRLPGTAGLAAPPIQNVGRMQNTGFDLSVGHRGASWSATLNGSHYKNKILAIGGSGDFFYGPIATRFGNQVINKIGQPIGAFYGYVADGFFKDAADVTASPKQDGAAPGRIKFRDTNGDGQITLADRTIIGSPHPDFTGGLDLTFRRGAFELGGTIFGTFGNKIFDVQKEFYVFRDFSTNVRKDLLANSWTPVDATVPRAQYTTNNPNPKYPILDINDTYSRAVSSYYVESGSYVRMTNLQLAWDVPQRYARWLASARVYVQAENLFTITGYNGLDPALPAANVTGAAGDIRDQYRGVDRGSYPSSRTLSVGIITSF